MSDKDLAKVLDRDEKRKRSANEGGGANRGKRRGSAKTGGFRPQQAAWQQTACYGQYPAAIFQPPPPPPPLPPQGQAAQLLPRVETRICLICKQPGHLFKFCPNKPGVAAALGAAPK